MLFKSFCFGWFLLGYGCNQLIAVPNEFPQSPNFTSLSEKGFFAGLERGDDRQVVLDKLQRNGFLGYQELQSDLIKSPVRWDGFAYELTCKFEENELSLCLIQGEAGWQDFFYDDILRPQWAALRNRITKVYGVASFTRDFPDLLDVPLNDKGGLITDKWDFKDRFLILTVQAYTQQDCCTRQVLDFSCCTLLIQPK